MTGSVRRARKDAEEQMERQAVNEMKSPVLSGTPPPGDTTTGRSDWRTHKISQ